MQGNFGQPGQPMGFGAPPEYGGQPYMDYGMQQSMQQQQPVPQAQGVPPQGGAPGYGGGNAFESNVLKLKGLPFSATEQDLFAFFQGFGTQAVHLHYQPDGRPSGMAFVEFANPEEARRAMARDRAYMGERFVKVLRVPRAEMEEQLGQTGSFGESFGGGMHGGAMGFPGPGGFAGQHGFGGPRFDMGGPPQGQPFGGFQQRGPPPQQGHFGGGGGHGAGMGRGGYGPRGPPPDAIGPRGTVLKMRGLPFRIAPTEVLSFFNGYEFVAESLHMGSDQMGRPSGEAWIAFASPEEAERAQRERNREYIGSRYIELQVL